MFGFFFIRIVSPSSTALETALINIFIEARDEMGEKKRAAKRFHARLI
jgi:hypothetical protein